MKNDTKHQSVTAKTNIWKWIFWIYFLVSSFFAIYLFVKVGYRILDAGVTYTHGMEANHIGSELKSLSEILDNNYNKKHIEEKLEHYSYRYDSVQINQNSIQLDKATLYFNEGELYKITLLAPNLEDN